MSSVWLSEHCTQIIDAIEDTSILYALSNPSQTLGHFPLSQSISVTVADKAYELSQRPEYLRGGSGVTGAVLWSSTPILLSYLLACGIFRDQNVILELGSGIGLSACVLGEHCNTFIASDHDLALLKLIRKNCDANNVDTVHLLQLDWSDPPLTYLKTLKSLIADGTISTILCLDCVYNSHLAKELIQCLVAITSAYPDTRIIIGQQLREEGVHAEFMAQICEQYDVWRVDTEEHDQHIELSGYGLYIAQTKLKTYSSGD